MSVEDAKLIINRGEFGELKKVDLRNLVDQIYADMAAGAGIQSVVAGTTASIVGDGTVSVSVDDTDPLNPVIDLSFA